MFVNTIVLLANFSMLVVSIINLVAIRKLITPSCLGFVTFKNDSYLKFKKMKFYEFIDEALMELETDENITAMVLDVKIDVAMEEKMALMTQLLSGRISQDEYDERVSTIDEKRIYLSYDSPEDSRIKLLSNRNKFIKENAYLSYDIFYNVFKNSKENTYELLKLKEGLKSLSKDKLAQHFADIIDR